MSGFFFCLSLIFLSGLWLLFSSYAGSNQKRSNKLNREVMNLIAIGNFLNIRFVVQSWLFFTKKSFGYCFRLESPNLIQFCSEKFDDLRTSSTLRLLVLIMNWFSVQKVFGKNIVFFPSDVTSRVEVWREGMRFVSWLSNLFVIFHNLESFWWIIDKNLPWGFMRNCCRAICTSLVTLFKIFFATGFLWFCQAHLA